MLRMIEQRNRKAAIFNAVALFTLVVLAVVWTVTALSFQSPQPWRWIWVFVTLGSGITILAVGRSRPALGWGLVVAALLAVGFWWSSIRPSSDRDWAPDVARGVTAEIGGTRVVVHNVRDFDWRTRTEFTPHWETRTYDLDDLISVDLINSVWANPAVAHTLIRFSFSQGEPLVFSAEIRREGDEVFSEIGGFFKQFELVLIAADERDIVRLRSDVRGETVSQFRLRMTPYQARALFLNYLNAGNALDREPRFYQTVTTNCITVIYKLAKLVQPGIPADWRILVSGYLPDYLYDHHLIRTDLPLAEVRRQAILRAGP